MNRLKIREAFVVSSQAVDEEPVWSPKGDFLAANVEGNWIKIDLSRLRLESATWHGDQPIGVIDTKSSESPVSEHDVKTWRGHARFNPRRIKSKNGTVIELQMSDLGTSLIITRKGKVPELRWTSGLENCHSLALSPDERFVAFIAELNGVVLERL